MTHNVGDHEMQYHGGGVPAGRGERLRARIVERFAPIHLALDDESARHAGHAGVLASGPAAASGETHYALLVVSEAFMGLNRVQRSRLVHAALDDEFRNGLHALSLTLRTTEEQLRHDVTAGIG